MRRWVSLAVVVLLAGGAAPALAQFQFARESGPSAQPLDRIIEGIRNSRPGSFYDAEGPFPGPDGRMHYRIKWMTPEGRVIWLDTDARTGRVLGTDSGGRRSGGDEGESRRAPRTAPDQDGERFRRHDEDSDRFERGRSWPDPFDSGGGERGGFERDRGRGDGNGRGGDGRGRYDRGDFGGRDWQDRGRRGPNER